MLRQIRRYKWQTGSNPNANGDPGAEPDKAADAPTPPGKRRVEILEVGAGAKLGGFASPIGGGIFGRGGKVGFSSKFGGGLFGNSQQRGVAPGRNGPPRVEFRDS